jgi:hypothetical protein
MAREHYLIIEIYKLKEFSSPVILCYALRISHSFGKFG